MPKLHPLHTHSPFRIFAFSITATIVALLGTLFGMGWSAAWVTVVLIAVEIAFSFENAVINAKVLAKMSAFWQKMFLSVGIIIAIFGMRVVFPILIVMITTHLSWSAVFDLAVNHPEEYAHQLELAHPAIAAFGGAFLLMLTLHFFLDSKRKILWFKRLEQSMQQVAHTGLPLAITAGVITLVSLLPANHHRRETLIAGLLGAVIYVAIHELTKLFEVIQRRKGGTGPRVGWAALWTFVYLEVLDASFSFDGVIGAFAITNQVILIAVGLGVGAIWVRSLTVFMVRRGTLKNYIYLEHGAHYTVGVLAGLFLLSIFVNVPEVIAGLAGLGLIGSSIVASRQARAAAGT